MNPDRKVGGWFDTRGPGGPGSPKIIDSFRPGRALPFAMPDFLNRLAGRLAPPAHTDADLLARFVQDRDQAAFAALVHRHGPTVYGVCRRILGNAADADDTFQAVFLVLVNRADALAGRPALGDWLYGVAVRAALKARTGFARLRKHERRAAETRSEAMSDPTPADPSWLDRELAALPDKFRRPVVLCLIQDRPRAEAAAELGIPEGTLASRLDTARKRLADRLARHRVPLVLTGLLVPVPAAVADGVVSRATDGAGVAIQLLANEVTKTMTTTSKLPVLIGAGVLTLAVGGLLLAAGPGDRNARPNAPAPQKKDKEPEPEPAWAANFRKAYQLKDGEFVKRVAPPYIDERKEFLLDRYRKRSPQEEITENSEGVRSWLAMGALFLEDDGKTVTYKTMVSTDAEDPRRPGVKAKPKLVRLSTVIERCTGRVAPEVVYDEGTKHQIVDMEGDLVIRKDAPLAKLLPDLQKALAAGDADVVLTLKEEEREVYVVGGKFAIQPREWREKDEIDVYADEAVLDKGYSHRSPEPNHALQTVWNNSTTVGGFARHLGWFLDKWVVCDTEFPSQTKFHWYMHARWERKATAAAQAADRDPEKVLANVTEQTGLTFKKEKRKVPVLYVSEKK